MPWDPTGAIIGPLAAMALFFGRKRKRSKWDILVIVLLLGLTAGMGLVACGPASSTTPPPGSDNTAPPVLVSTQTPVPVGAGTSPSNTTSTATPPIILTELCPEAPLTSTPIPTGTPTPTPTPSVKLTARAQEIRGWATELGYSTTDVLAVLLNREALNPSLEDSRWFTTGGAQDPAEIYREAATRWYWSWIKDATIISIYGMASNDVDREAMAYQWIVNAMQSEDGWTKDILRSQHDTLRPEFINIANSVLHPLNSEWARGDGSWGWANQYLYAAPAHKILNEENLYHWGSGSTTWYIINTQTLAKVCQYNLYIDTSRC